MSQDHVTYHDDCGCQSAALKARIATLEQRERDLMGQLDISEHKGMGFADQVATLKAELAEERAGHHEAIEFEWALRRASAERRDAAEANAVEQARLVGMGSEREARLLAQLADERKHADALDAAAELFREHSGCGCCAGDRRYEALEALNALHATHAARRAAEVSS